MKISWLLLTWNRAAVVEDALLHNAACAGRQADEIVWCDNGSSPADHARIAEALARLPIPITHVHYPANRGVARGYNTALALATGTHVVITGCDMRMPDAWLEEMARAWECVPRAGIVSIYWQPLGEMPHCIRGEPFEHEGLRLQPGTPFGRRFLSIELHRRIGYLREFEGSLYGWEDTAWGARAETVCRELGLLPLVLLDRYAEPIHSDEPHGDFASDAEYVAWKRAQVEAARPLYEASRILRSPRFSPFE
ncbi:MAG: glycosyltransferase family A protein [Chthoniobacteraceae bacterium]